MPIDDKDSWSLEAGWRAEGVSGRPPFGARWPSVNECTPVQKTKAIAVVMTRCMISINEGGLILVQLESL